MFDQNGIGPDEATAEAKLAEFRKSKAGQRLAALLRGNEAKVAKLLATGFIRTAYDGKQSTLFELTKIAKLKGKVTKSVRRKPDGSGLDIDSSQCKIGRGTMFRVPVTNLHDIGSMFEETPDNVAYLLGSLASEFGDNIPVVADKNPLSKEPGFATRSKTNITYRAGVPGLVLIDYDDKGMPPDVKARLQNVGGFVSALELICPGIEVAGTIYRASTTSGIYDADTGKKYPRSGQHVYVLIEDAADADRFLKTLHERAYLMGFGWTYPAKNGRGLLERSIIDVSVRFAYRLVFEAAPDLEPGLAQDHRPAVVYDLPPLDSKRRCTDLVPAEKANLGRVIANDRRAVAPAAAAANKAFKDAKRADMASRGVDADRIETTLARMDEDVLGPGVRLDFVSLPGNVTVADVLAAPDKFDGEVLYDPVEGREYGHSTAKFYADGLIIHSFAHGKSIYKLRHDYQSIEAAINGAGRDAANVLVRLMVIAKVGMDEEDQLVNIAKKVSGVRVPVIRKMLEDGREKRRKEIAEILREKWPPPPPPVDGDGDYPIPDSHKHTRLKEFRAYMPTHEFVYVPTREMWPAVSVNDQVPPIEVGVGEDEKPILIAASTWLAHYRHVEQMTWAPGEPIVVRNRVIMDGGWIDKLGDTVFNLYLPPTIRFGDPSDVAPWLDHFRLIYPSDLDHMIRWLAFKVQHPDIKINHALVMGGPQGIGKDTLLEPVKHGVGHWNFKEISPADLKEQFNPYIRSVILRISEARDLGEVDLYALYEATKTLIASPPDVLKCNEKHIRHHTIVNVTGVVYTTNYRTTGLYLPADDRRHYVAWSEKVKEDFGNEYWDKLWDWYENGGLSNVVAYLRSFDLSSFNPKAPPPLTNAWHAIVDANCAPEEAELADALEVMGDPDALTILTLAEHVADLQLRQWLMERKNSRLIPHRLEKAGYVRVRNDADARDGLWQVSYCRRTLVSRSGVGSAVYDDGAPRVKRQAIYAKKTLTP